VGQTDNRIPIRPGRTGVYKIPRYLLSVITLVREGMSINYLRNDLD